MSFDFSSLNVNTVKAEAPALSTSQIQQSVKDIAVERVFEYLSIQDMVRTDTHKYAMPIDFNGEIHWVEVSFVAKKDDFDARKAEHDYQVKLQHGLEREQERQAKRAEKAKKA